MSTKGDWSRVKDRKTYDENMERIAKKPRASFCRHHVISDMKCYKCEAEKKHDIMLDN